MDMMMDMPKWKKNCKKVLEFLLNPRFLLCFGLIMLYSTSSYYGSTRFGDAAYWMQLHEDMCQAGFYIKTVEESCERFAVIDQEVVWYGNINLLAKDKVDDSIMRVLSKEIASELMEITFGDNGCVE